MSYRGDGGNSRRDFARKETWDGQGDTARKIGGDHLHSQKSSRWIGTVSANVLATLTELPKNATARKSLVAFFLIHKIYTENNFKKSLFLTNDAGLI